VWYSISGGHILTPALFHSLAVADFAISALIWSGEIWVWAKEFVAISVAKKVIMTRFISNDPFD
jgi:hypothetical protein